jgi:hypothetical protein
MKRTLADTVKSLLGETFLKYAVSISYGERHFRVNLKANVKRVNRIRFYVQGNGTFTIDVIRQSKQSINSRVYENVAGENLGAFVNKLLGIEVSI